VNDVQKKNSGNTERKTVEITNKKKLPSAPEKNYTYMAMCPSQLAIASQNT